MPDHFIIVRADQCVYWRAVALTVEMKREDWKPSDVSEEQKVWLDAFGEVADVESFVAYGAREAIKFVSQFVINPKKYDW